MPLTDYHCWKKRKDAEEAVKLMLKHPLSLTAMKEQIRRNEEILKGFKPTRKSLRKMGKKHNVLIDLETIRSQEFLDRGAEASVYISEIYPKHVDNVVDYTMFSYTPMLSKHHLHS
ncbi:hypothetical protein Barb6XT_02856 [Bacteroidales bacterium Barb6XT]|nr:hypothetical protein Barb6XT_02856 [Bacteroidales bacterium Barb6XT]